MDEPGVIVLESQEGQPARIAPVGGTLNALWGSWLSIDGRPGVVGITAVHLSKDSKDQYPAADKLTLETGRQEEQGKMAVFWPDFLSYGEGRFVRCKAAANRACVLALMELAQVQTDADLWLVFAAMSRLEGRGAQAAAAAIRPRTVICLEPLADGGISCEYDGATLILPLMDKGSIHDADLHAAAKKICSEQKTRFKIPQSAPGGTGASFAGRQAGGARTMTIGLPSRYQGTGSESVRMADVEAMAKLTAELLNLQEMAN